MSTPDFSPNLALEDPFTAASLEDPYLSELLRKKGLIARTISTLNVQHEALETSGPSLDQLERQREAERLVEERTDFLRENWDRCGGDPIGFELLTRMLDLQTKSGSIPNDSELRDEAEDAKFAYQMWAGDNVTGTNVPEG